MIWSMLRDIFSFKNFPSLLQDFAITWLQGKGPFPSRLTLLFYAGFAWSLWTTRNKMTIEKCLHKTPIDVLYIVISLMQRQSVLLKKKDQECVTQTLEALLGWIKNF